MTTTLQDGLIEREEYGQLIATLTRHASSVPGLEKKSSTSYAGSAFLTGDLRYRLLDAILDDKTVKQLFSDIVRLDLHFQVPALQAFLGAASPVPTAPHDHSLQLVILDGVEEVGGSLSTTFYTLLDARPWSFVLTLSECRAGALELLNSLEKRAKSRHSQVIVDASSPNICIGVSLRDRFIEGIVRADPQIRAEWLRRDNASLCIGMANEELYENECRWIACESLNLHQLCILLCVHRLYQVHLVSESEQPFVVVFGMLAREWQRLLREDVGVGELVTSAASCIPQSLEQVQVAVEGLVSLGFFVETGNGANGVDLVYSKWIVGRVHPGSQLGEILQIASSSRVDCPASLKQHLVKSYGPSAAPQ